MNATLFSKNLPYISGFRYQMGNSLFLDHPRIPDIVHYPVFPTVYATDYLRKLFCNQTFDLTCQVQIQQAAVYFLIIRIQNQTAAVAHHRSMDPQFFPDGAHSFWHTG